MRKNNWFFIGALVTIIALVFILGCGGGGDGDDNVIAVNHEYVIENVQWNLAEVNDWSDNGSIWRTESKEGNVFQDGKAENFQLEWDFPIRAGDQLDASFDAMVVGGGEVLIRVVSKIDGKTKTVYAEGKFSFSSGKNIIPSLIVGATDNQAKVIMMLGKKAGKYQFLTPISVKRTRIKTILTKITIVDIGKCKFSSDSGSIWDPKTGTINSKMGSQRASTKLQCSEIPIEAGVVNRIILTAYSMPVGDIVAQLRSSSDKTLGERILEPYGKDMVLEIIPLETAINGTLRFLFGLSAGTFKLENPIRFEVE